MNQYSETSITFWRLASLLTSVSVCLLITAKDYLYDPISAANNAIKSLITGFGNKSKLIPNPIFNYNQNQNYEHQPIHNLINVRGLGMT